MTDSGTSTSRFASDSPDARLFERIHATVAATPAPTMGMRARILAALAVAVCLTTGAVFLASYIVYHEFTPPGVDVYVRSPVHLAIVLLLLLVQTSLATSITISRGAQGFGSSLQALGLVAWLVTPLYAALVALSPVHDDLPAAHGVPLSHLGFRCMALAAIVGSLVMASLAVALRHSVPVASRLRGVAVGAAAGCWAGLSVFLFCPSGNHDHLFVGHVLPIAAFTLLGGLILPRHLRL